MSAGRLRGREQLEDWEVHFREKSSRRARAHASGERMKLGVLLLLFAGLAAAAWLTTFGLPR
jgi:hypothetical protein